MSQHRRHYFDLNPPPGSWFKDLPPITIAARFIPDWMLVVLVLIVLGAHALAVALAPDAPVITPVRTPQALHYRLQAVEDARIEGYRAGYSDAVAAQGCRRPVLSHPIQPL